MQFANSSANRLFVSVNSFYSVRVQMPTAKESHSEQRNVTVGTLAVGTLAVYGLFSILVKWRLTKLSVPCFVPFSKVWWLHFIFFCLLRISSIIQSFRRLLSHLTAAVILLCRFRVLPPHTTGARRKSRIHESDGNREFSRLPWFAWVFTCAAAALLCRNPQISDVNTVKHPPLD